MNITNDSGFSRRDPKAIDRKNDKLCADVARLAAEHAEMAVYIESALPFLQEVRDCEVYGDGKRLLEKVRQ